MINGFIYCKLAAIVRVECEWKGGNYNSKLTGIIHSRILIRTLNKLIDNNHNVKILMIGEVRMIVLSEITAAN